MKDGHQRTWLEHPHDTVVQIDEAVKKIVLEARDRVTQLLSENIVVLKAVAQELLEKETIMLEDIDRIIAEHNNEQETTSAAVPPVDSQPPGESAQH